MARPPRSRKERNPAATDGQDEIDPPETGASRPTLDSPTKLWIDEHWHGWVKPVSGILALALAYVAYSQRWIGEGLGGPLMVLAIVGGTIVGTSFAVWPALTNQTQRGLFAAFVGVWAISTGYPSLRAALPKTPLAEKKLGEVKEHLSETFSLPSEKGPYELFVGGNLKGSGEVEAGYHLTVTGENGTTDEVVGAVKRSIVHQRVSRRGGTSTQRQERNENVHRLDHVQGGEIKVALEGADDQLEDGLTVTVLRAGLNPIIFVVGAALCLLLGLFIDYRLATVKTKTYVTMAAGFLLVFAWDFPTEATPHFQVPPAVGSAVKGFLIGGLGGALVAFIARQMKPKELMKVKGIK